MENPSGWTAYMADQQQARPRGLSPGVRASTVTVDSDFGTVRLDSHGTTPKRDPSWVAPGMAGWSPNAPSGPYNAGGPFWRPF